MWKGRGKNTKIAGTSFNIVAKILKILNTCSRYWLFPIFKTVAFTNIYIYIYIYIYITYYILYIYIYILHIIYYIYVYICERLETLQQYDHAIILRSLSFSGMSSWIIVSTRPRPSWHYFFLDIFELVFLVR